MYLGLRPYVTSGVAIVGAAVLLAAPVTLPPAPDSRQIQVTAFELTGSAEELAVLVSEAGVAQLLLEPLPDLPGLLADLQAAPAEAAGSVLDAFAATPDLLATIVVELIRGNSDAPNLLLEFPLELTRDVVDPFATAVLDNVGLAAIPLGLAYQVFQGLVLNLLDQIPTGIDTGDLPPPWTDPPPPPPAVEEGGPQLPNLGGAFEGLAEALAARPLAGLRGSNAILALANALPTEDVPAGEVPDGPPPVLPGVLKLTVNALADSNNVPEPIGGPDELIAKAHDNLTSVVEDIGDKTPRPTTRILDTTKADKFTPGTIGTKDGPVRKAVTDGLSGSAKKFGDSVKRFTGGGGDDGDAKADRASK